MVIEIDSEVWTSAEHEESLHTEILDFLKENQNKAFSSREICDEILDTDFETTEERTRLEHELSEEEYDHRFRNRELPRQDDEDYTLISFVHRLLMVSVALDQLTLEGLIESREIPTENLDIPYDWEAQTHYTIAE